MTELDQPQDIEDASSLYAEEVCFFAIRLSNLDWLRDTIQQHSPLAQYLLTGEIATTSHKHSDGEHIHCYWRVPKNTQTGYDAIRNAVKRKFKLVGKAVDGVGRQYGKIRNLRDAERLKIYMLKEQNMNMVRTNYLNKEELLAYMGSSFIKAQNIEKWKKMQAFAHKLMKKYNEKFTPQKATWDDYINGNMPEENEELDYSIMPHFPNLKFLSECNDYYLTINDGLPLAKNSLIRLSFEMKILTSERYVYNTLKFIMFE